MDHQGFGKTDGGIRIRLGSQTIKGTLKNPNRA
jgi:hypothetical protein